MNKLLFALILLTVTACSNKAWYDNMRLNERNECAKLPASQYDDCIEGTQKSYDEYEREREALLIEE